MVVQNKTYFDLRVFLSFNEHTFFFPYIFFSIKQRKKNIFIFIFFYHATEKLSLFSLSFLVTKHSVDCLDCWVCKWSTVTSWLQEKKHITSLRRCQEEKKKSKTEVWKDCSCRMATLLPNLVHFCQTTHQHTLLDTSHLRMI